MGVPLLLTWLRRSFSSCFYPAEGDLSKGIRGSVDNLYIDLNSLLYQSSQIISVGRGHFHTVEEVEDAVLRKLYDLLDDIIFNLVQPQALVYVAVDGISPLGKMSQQRSRRLRQSQRTKSHTTKRHYHGNHSSSNADDVADRPGLKTETMDSLWDNNCITVGTRFMAKVTEALHAYAVSRTERMNVRRMQDATAAAVASAARPDSAAPASFTPLSIVIDDVLRPGEGENKILEVIRRFREHTGYNANLMHCICSSDTDVTVSSLLLHEPRMFVLRYEPPAALGGKDPAFAASRAGPSPGGVDSWLSTFFSIYMFREGLRKLLGLAPIVIPPVGGAAAKPQDAAAAPSVAVAVDPRVSALPEVPQVSAESAAAFECALHDVVFVMLLFGNDFLPALGGSIQEGTLDALLALLASDFVSRGKTVVDPDTNHIRFTSARYLLDCLSDIRGQNRNGGTLSINGGGGRHSNNGLSGADTWGFDEDPEFQKRKAEREKRLERKCYCYWTMLQWALQYSAGVVDHWGCYYPFSDAPPLYALKKYCGVLSYDALVTFVASRHAARQAGRDAEDLDLPTSPTAAAAAAGSGPLGEHIKSRLTSKPTDAMVQLLVLTPQSSAVLLPTAFRNAYDEIAAAVRAPVEELDIAFVERWCDEKKRHFNEEERTRFSAYQLFASSDPLALSPAAVAAGGGGSGDESTAAEAAPQRPLPANEVTFMAYWDGGELSTELGAAHRQQRERLEKLAAVKAAAAPVSAPAAVAPAAPVRNVASFFGARRGKGPGAAAAALLQAPITPPPVAVPVAAAATDAPTAEKDSAASDPAVPSGPTVSAAVTLVTNPARSLFFLTGLTPAYLPTDSLVKAMGYLDGPRFVIAADSSSANKSSTTLSNVAATPLSRDAAAHQVRMKWRLAVAAPSEDGEEEAVLNARLTVARTGLLRGYCAPTAAGLTHSVREITVGKRAAEAEGGRADDPWREMESKRPKIEES